MNQSKDLTEEYKKVMQLCPEWAKEIMKDILQLPTLQDIYSLDWICELLKMETAYEKENGVFTDRERKPRFRGTELWKLKLKAVRYSQEDSNTGLQSYLYWLSQRNEERLRNSASDDNLSFEERKKLAEEIFCKKM